MKHFVIYRKLILIIGTATAVVSVGVLFFKMCIRDRYGGIEKISGRKYCFEKE